jgi:hypothetical protein
MSTGRKTCGMFEFTTTGHPACVVYSYLSHERRYVAFIVLLQDKIYFSLHYLPRKRQYMHRVSYFSSASICTSKRIQCVSVIRNGDKYT